MRWKHSLGSVGVLVTGERPMIKRPEPAVGQVWESVDPREFRRRMEIVRIDGEYAHMKNLKTGRMTRIHLHRLTHSLGRRGYGFVR